MSLLDDAFEDYTIINKIISPDGYGGTITLWEDGATIKGAMRFDNSMTARIGMTQGVTSVYTFTTRKNIILNNYDVLRRESDGKIFRVTSDGDDSFTPESATLNMRQVSCEEWRLPNG